MIETIAMVFGLTALGTAVGFCGWVVFWRHDPYLAGDDGEDY